VAVWREKCAVVSDPDTKPQTDNKIHHLNCDVTAALIGVIGVLLGILIGNRFQLGRDKADRKRTFRSFMRQWWNEIATVGPQADPFSPFNARINQFHAEAAKIEGDFRSGRRRKFQALVTTLNGLDRHELRRQQKPPDKAMFEVIDALIGFAA
jgi:hypothetical protein